MIGSELAAIWAMFVARFWICSPSKPACSGNHQSSLINHH
jgi:hypothetical protein